VYPIVMSVKKENFKRIAENRTNKILAMIELLGNLSNSSFYEFNEEEIDKIFSTIQEGLNNQRNKFTILNSSKKKKRFEL
jgi:hypothetical protein